MKVIKHGKQYDDGKPFKGECNCGCVVEVTRKEIQYQSDQREGSYYYVQCPECFSVIYIEDKRIE